MRIQFLLCEEWFQRQISRLLTDPSELFSSQLLMGCRTGSFVYSRKPVLSAESEAKARAIAEKNGTLEMKWFWFDIWFVSRGNWSPFFDFYDVRRLRTGLVVAWNPFTWHHSLVCILRYFAVANNPANARVAWWRVVTCENEEVLRDRQCLSWSATSGLFISGVYEPGCSLSNSIFYDFHLIFLNSVRYVCINVL